MKVARTWVEKEITKKFQQSLTEFQGKKSFTEWRDAAKAQYDLPNGIFSDYATLRKDLTDASEYLLFIFASVMMEDKLDSWFTPIEIREYLRTKWEVSEAKFPLKFSVIQIADDQFIGKISVKELMLLRDSQLINYNENAQRTMRHIIKGNAEYYQISLNKSAVSAIMESYKSDLYIANTITLNLPEDADYKYDEKTNELIVRNTKYFDILDGYHRYVAMSKVYNQDEDFDYNMELRITVFSDDKGRRFIWQEDQKTKMKKVDSDSMNTAKAASRVVERLNESPTFILTGKIVRNGKKDGVINAPDLINIIDIIYFKNVNKKDEMIKILEVQNNLTTFIEKVISKNPKLLNEKWERKFVYTVVYESLYGNISSLNKDYKKIIKDKSIYNNSLLTTGDITRTHKLLEGKTV